MERKRQLERRIRILLVGFMIGLIVSGFTAFPLPNEVTLLSNWLGVPEGIAGTQASGLLGWLGTVREGLIATEARYPFLFYGTDWLAFGHLVIAILFLGPIKDPVRNVWVVQWGMIACILVVPTALICGEVRGIPLAWRLIDCSFGAVGLIPLIFCLRAIREIDPLTARELDREIK